MKKIMIVFLLLTAIVSQVSAQDSLTKRLNGLEQSVTAIQTSLIQLNQKLPVMQPVAPQNSNQNQPRQLSKSQKWFVVMPVIIFLIIFFTLLIWLNRGGFSLAEALEGDVPIKVEQANTALADATKAATLAAGQTALAAAAAGVTTTPVQVTMPSNIPSTVTVSQTDENNNPVLPKSSSRFIALFSGFAGVIVALCLVSYYVYFAIAGIPSPDFNAMIEAVLGLGVGVVPYAVTKFTQK